MLGDIAFVHDSNALTALTSRSADLRVVVVDNDGGGIFSFLPQERELSRERFEQLFGTPHGTDVVALAAAHGVAAHDVATLPELADVVTRPGPWLVRVRTDRAANRDVHAALEAAVAALSEPGRFAEAEAAIARVAPQLQGILAQALEEGGWFAEGHGNEVVRIAELDDPEERVHAVRVLLAEEARMGMMVGVAVGWALAGELTEGEQ